MSKFVRPYRAFAITFDFERTNQSKYTYATTVMIVKEISTISGQYVTQRWDSFEDFASIATKVATATLKSMENTVMEYITFIVICVL